MMRPACDDQPLISIDVVAVRYEPGRQALQVWLGRRVFEPYIDEFALPGVLLRHERIADAAQRALTTKLGAQPPHTLWLGDVGVFDNPDRDPRGPTLSISKFAVLSGAYTPEPGRHTAVDLTSARRLPFDHDHIVDRAAAVLAEKLWSEKLVAQALLGGRFSTRDVAGIQRQLLERGSPTDPPTIDAANLLRHLKKTGWVRRVDTGTSTKAGGRPPTVWEWV